MRRDLGDFQTPAELVDAVLEALGPIGERWPRVLEPTCGSGSFIAGLLRTSSPPLEIKGLELQERHLAAARRHTGPGNTAVELRRANLFATDLRRSLRWSTTGRLLVVGNPPWVTNAELGAMGSDNVPKKANLKGLRGIDAMTGESNFDIAESIWLKLLVELAEEAPTIALLCKTAVARNVLRHCHATSIPVTAAWLRRIDARRWFKAAVDACLFCVEIGAGEPRYEAAVFPSLESASVERVIAVCGGRLVSDLAAYRRSQFADGVSPLAWRQGLKHDAAAVMELRTGGSGYVNKLDEPADVEPEYLYPLLKSSDLFRQERPEPRHWVIVTQRKLGESTKILAHLAPRLWRYLNQYRAHFEKRKSSIYRTQPPFAIFGIGDYSFSPYKVAISGLYKEPRFRALGLREGRPVMLDDTAYFLPCASAQQAAVLVSVLNHPITLDLINSLVFWDAKRPITKKVLQRIGLNSLLDHLDQRDVLRRATKSLDSLAPSARLDSPAFRSPEDALIPRESAPGYVQTTLF